MALGYRLKHYFLNAFRELFLYHHSSLEFRAKLFAAVIAANEHAGECEYEMVKQTGLSIYSEKDRANTLVLTTKEYVEKVIDKNGLDIDALIHDIIRELKAIPRYAQKIHLEQFQPFIDCTEDNDTKAYQERIVELFARLKEEYENVA
jgi:hypothetical protein